MPAYNFKKEFVPMILDGSKPHTIRRRRKNPTKVGDTLYLYTGMRTKACEKVTETVCIKVEPVVIYPMQYLMEVNGKKLSIGNLDALAIRDGFPGGIMPFMRFFQQYRAEPLDDFELIWWDAEKVKNANKN